MRALAALLALYVPATLATAAWAFLAGAPFAWWFRDTPVLLGLLLGAVLALGVAWDGLLLWAGVIGELVRRRRPAAVRWPTRASTRTLRFFPCGPLPIAILLLTGFAVIGTSNLTLISLHLLKTSQGWRDALLWSIEGSLLSRLQYASIDVAAWDRLYHGAWAIEVFAAFVLVLVARGPRIVLQYGASMIVVFYVGRVLGVFNPVMGPAFHRPEAFAYLHGSVSERAMTLVAQVLTSPTDQLIARGGILLGGVSAMPSLHVAMVSLTAYWLAHAQRWTLLLTVPWVLAVWTSTVVLGWHYALDGAGGIVLAALSVLCVRRLRLP